jgi:hypothetical protein
MEYEGLIANAGLRVEGWNASWWKFYPDCTLYYPYYPPDMMGQGSFQDLMFKLRDEGLAQGDSTYYYIWRKFDKIDYKLKAAACDSPRTHPFWQQVWGFYDLIPRKRPKTMWRYAPRIGVSHPVGQNTKFFFNFGWMYSIAPTAWRYGLGTGDYPLGYTVTNNHGVGNPEIDMPRTVAYEVGFEQSIQNTYIARIKGYAKDDTDKPQSYEYVTYDQSKGTTAEGGSITGTQSGAYLSRRGIEVTLAKVSGRYITGTFNFDYFIYSSGNVGYRRIAHDSLSLSVAPDVRYDSPWNESRSQPSFWGNVVLHTPTDWGHVSGDWHLSVKQSWTRGALGGVAISRLVGAPSVELRMRDYWNTDLRLSKTFAFGGRSVSLYMDVTNLTSHKVVNPNAFDDKAYEYYMEQFTERLTDGSGRYVSKGLRLGDSRFNRLAEEKLSQTNDWFLYLGSIPRQVMFGVRVDL